jgi:hypothetical protein
MYIYSWRTAPAAVLLRTPKTSGSDLHPETGYPAFIDFPQFLQVIA